MVSKKKKTKKRKKATIRKKTSFLQELVIAPPGCGKTHLLAKEIAQALQTDGSPPRILCLTFTDQAAMEMRSRVSRQGGNARKENLFIGTLHSYCLDTLDRHSNSRIAIIDDEMFEEFANWKDPSDKEHTSLREFNQGIQAGKGGKDGGNRKRSLEISDQRVVMKAFQMSFSGRFRPVKRWSDARNDKLKYYTERYIAYKQALNTGDGPRYLDFNDLLLEAWNALEGGAWDNVSKYDLVFVDEVQDLTGLHLRIIMRLVAPKGTIRYYGDPQQAIYSFMGAKVRNLLSLKRQCRKTRKKRINYRSPQYLVQAINRYYEEYLSDGNKWEDLQDVWMQLSSSAMKKAPLVEHAMAVLRASSTEREIEGIANLIDSFPLKESNAILVRNNEDVQDIVRKLKSKNKYLIVESKDMVHTYPLRLMANHIQILLNFASAEKDKWRRMLPFILGSGSRMDPKLINNMFDFGLHPAVLMLDEILPGNASLGEDLLARWGIRIIRHKLLCKYSPLRDKFWEDRDRVSQSKEPEKLNQLVLDRVAAWYQAFVDAGLLPSYMREEWHAAKGVIQKRMYEEFPVNEESVIDQEAVEKRLRFIAEECEKMRPENYLLKTNTDRRIIYVMTVHQAKGRGFDNVFMYEARTDVYRRFIKEDLRIYYVGITRAIKRIILTLSCNEDRLEELGSEDGVPADIGPRYGKAKDADIPWFFPTDDDDINDDFNEPLFDLDDVYLP